MFVAYAGHVRISAWNQQRARQHVLGTGKMFAYLPTQLKKISDI
jgi:hypothetical protein